VAVILRMSQTYDKLTPIYLHRIVDALIESKRQMEAVAASFL